MSTFKEHLKSFLITFVSSFALAILPGFGTVDFTKGALLALLIAGVRAGFKAVLEMLTVVGPTTTIKK